MDTASPLSIVESGSRAYLPRRILPVALALSVWLFSYSSFATCTREAVDLPVTITEGRPVITAKINDAEVRFLVDSGAFYSMITPAAAAELNLKTRNAPLGLRVGGLGGVTVPTITVVKAFTLKNVTMPNVEFLVAGSGVGGGSIGVLGQNLLQRWDVEYNLAQGMIRLMKDTDCRGAMLAYWAKPSDPVSLIEIDKTTPTEPHTTAYAYVNGVKIRVAFDTGASVSLMTRRAAEHAGIALDGPGVVDVGLMGGVGSQMVKTYIVPVESFKFADGEEIRHTKIRVADANLDFTDMLIGADFFLSHRIFLAHSQSKLYFTYIGGPVFNLANAPSTSSPAVGKPSGPAAGAQQPAETSQPADQPADAAAWARRGSAFAARRDFDHAIADLTRACELEPANAEYLFERGQTYRQKGDAKNAAADFDHVLELKPDHMPALMNRAELRIVANNTASAQADLDALDKLAAKQADVRFDMAVAYEEAGLMDPAIKQLDAWVASHQEDARLPTALTNRCRARAVLGRDLDVALRDCNAAVSRSFKGNNARILANRGFLRLRLADYGKALEDYDAALKIIPQFAGALYGRGLARIKTQKLAEGEADIANAEKIAPKIAEQFKALGIAP